MAAAVYSTRFLSAQIRTVPEGTAAIYTVPALKVAVIRTIDVWAATAGTVLFGRRVGTAVYPLWSSAGVASSFSRTWEGHQVFVAGESMGCLWQSGDIFVTVSGFLLGRPPV